MRKRAITSLNVLVLTLVLGMAGVQTGDIVNTSPGTSFTPGGCPGWKRMW
jgi:hypothetical protein